MKKLLAVTGYMFLIFAVADAQSSIKKPANTLAKATTKAPLTSASSTAPAAPVNGAKKQTAGEAIQRKHHYKKVKEAMKTKAN